MKLICFTESEEWDVMPVVLADQSTSDTAALESWDTQDVWTSQLTDHAPNANIPKV